MSPFPDHPHTPTPHSETPTLLSETPTLQLLNVLGRLTSVICMLVKLQGRVKDAMYIQFMRAAVCRVEMEGSATCWSGRGACQRRYSLTHSWGATSEVAVKAPAQM